MLRILFQNSGFVINKNHVELMKRKYMHLDKFISTFAIILNVIAWDRISLITGAILAIVMTVYYLYAIYCKAKDRKNRDK